MPPPYNNIHWQTFAGIPYQAQGAVGDSPARWATGLNGVPNAANLPNAPMGRATVRDICRNPNHDVLYGYVCAMAWGGQNDRFQHRAQAWNNRAALIPKLIALRAGGLTHCQVYNLFTGANSVPGLGPSFFTKLIYFFSPDQPVGATGFYIMDQWTSKSVDLITQRWVVRLARIQRTSPGHQNRCGNYEAYCREVESIAIALGLGQGHGDQAEEMLMSKGSPNPWPWRIHVQNRWPVDAPADRYRRADIHALYHPYIPLACF